MNRKDDTYLGEYLRTYVGESWPVSDKKVKIGGKTGASAPERGGAAKTPPDYGTDTGISKDY